MPVRDYLDYSNQDVELHGLWVAVFLIRSWDSRVYKYGKETEWLRVLILPALLFDSGDDMTRCHGFLLL